MSLRKSPKLTPQLVAAARRNACHSTGPRSPAAKRHSRLNALKHGVYVSPENQKESMRALGEDPARFEALREELLSAFGPGDALLAKQVDDLAWLYWRRERLERAQTALKQRALQGIEDWQHRRQREMEGVTFDASRHEMLDVDLPDSNDRGVMLRKTLSLLGVIREEVQESVYQPRQKYLLEAVYKGREGWRAKLILHLLWGFWQALEKSQMDPEYAEILSRPDDKPPGEPERQDLLRLLGKEIADLEEEWAYAERQNQERAAIEREACLAPQGDTWLKLLREEGSMDRSIDRKVKILMNLRKDADLDGALAGEEGGAPSEGKEETVDANAELVEAVENTKLPERSGNVAENKGPGLQNRAESESVLEEAGACFQTEAAPLATPTGLGIQSHASEVR